MTGPIGREAGRVGVRAVPLTDGFGADLKKDLDAIEKQLSISIPVSLDTTAVTEDLRRLQADLDGASLSLSASLNTEDAQAELERLKASIGGSSEDIKVGVDKSSISSDISTVKSGLSTLAGIAKTIVIGASFAAAGSGLAVAVVQAVALASAIASAAGAAALIPAAIAGVAAIAATAVVGLSGISDALTASNKAASSSGTASNPNAAIDAARQIASAQRGLQTAYRNAADERVADAKRITDAEQAITDAQKGGQDTQASDVQAVTAATTNYTKAQRDLVKAQLQLNDAQASAEQNIEDLKQSLAGAVVDQQQAALDLAKAQADLAAVQSNDFSTDLEKQAAQVAVAAAAQKVAQTAQNYKDLATQSAKANAAGVAGATNVVSAQDQLTDAIQSTKDAQNDVVKAKKQEADDQVSSAKTILAAQQALSAAQHQQAEDQITSTNALLDAQDSLAQAQESANKAAGGSASANSAAAAAMAKLSPQGKALVTTLLALGPAWASVKLSTQDALLNGVSGKVSTLAARALPVLKTGLVAVGGSLNGVVNSLLTVASSSSTLSVVSTVFTDAKRSVDALRPSLAPIAQALLDVIKVGSGFGPGLAAGFTGFATSVAKSISSFANDGGLSKFISTAIATLKELGQILGNVGSIFVSVFEAGNASGQGLLAAIVQITGKMAAFLKSSQGQNDLGVVFSTAAAAVHAVVDAIKIAVPAVAGFFASLSGGGAAGGTSDLSKNFSSIRDDLTKIGPALGSAFKVAAVKTFSDGVSVASVVFGFLADHIGTLTTLMPLLVGAFIAYKAAQAADTLIKLIDIPLQLAYVVALTLSAAANRALAREMALARGEENVGIIAKLRALAVTIAQKVAQAAVAVATKAWAAAQWLLNAAMDANPIALIAIAVLALVAIIVLIATKTQFFQDIWAAAWGAIKVAFSAVLDFITAAWATIVDVLSGPVNSAVGAVKSAWQAVQNAFSAVINWIKQNWPLILAILTAPFGGVLVYLAVKFWGPIKDGFTAVKNWVGDRVSDIVGFFTGLGARVGSAATGAFNSVRNAMTDAKQWIHDRVDDVVGFFTGLPGRIATAASGLFDGVKNAATSALQAVAQIWNDTLGKISFKIPSWVPGIGGDGFSFPKITIPKLAVGADILPSAGGTLAVLGEGLKKETVTDYGLTNQLIQNANKLAMAALGKGGGAVQYNQYITTTEQDPTLIAAIVGRKTAAALV